MDHLSVDREIIHFERVLRLTGPVDQFPRAYWEQRISKVAASPGLSIMQERRLAELLQDLRRRQDEAAARTGADPQQNRQPDKQQDNRRADKRAAPVAAAAGGRKTDWYAL